MPHSCAPRASRAIVLFIAVLVSCAAVLAVTLSPAHAQQDNFLNGAGSIGGTTTFGNATYVPNAVAPVSGAVPAGAVSLTRGTVREGSGGTNGTHRVNFANGRLVMVYQSTGVVSPPTVGGSGFSLSNATAGHWEFARLDATNGVQGTTLNFTEPLIHDYPAGTSQVIAVPEYVNVTLNSASTRINAPEWDGSSGGVLAMMASGEVNFQSQGSMMEASGRGFRGGFGYRNLPESPYELGCLESELNSRGLTSTTTLAFKGEGFYSDAFTAQNPMTNIIQGGRGNYLQAGGGGNCFNASGGGGGNRGSGGVGGNSLNGTGADGGRAVGGMGGAAMTFDGSGPLAMGGGGGAGDVNNDKIADGQPGGGVIMLRGGNLRGYPRIVADGASGVSQPTSAAPYDGAGGGGAGGAAIIRMSSTIDCSGTAGTASYVRARGGEGGMNRSNGTNQWTPGGGGGGGVTYLQGSSVDSCGPSVTGGARGQARTQTGGTDLGAFGASNGSNGQATTVTTAMSKPSVTISSPTNGILTNDNTPTITGTAADGATSVTILINGVIAGTAPVSGGNWTFTVPSGDALSEAGHVITAYSTNTQNLSSDTAAARTITVDTTPPSLGISTPANGSIVSTTTPQLNFSVNDLHPSPTTQCSIDGGAWIDCSNGSNIGPLSQGPHSVSISHTDRAGNMAIFGSQTFTVDSIAPTVTLFSPNEDQHYNTTTPPLNFVVSDDNQGATSQCSIDGGGWTNCTSGSNLSPLSEGTHTIVVRNIDGAGNIGTSATHSFHIDTVAPAVDITGPAAPVNTTTPSISGTSDQPNGVMVVVRDSNSNVLCTSAVIAGSWGCTVSGSFALNEGSNTITAETIDYAGNSGSDSHIVSVDLTAPLIDITGPGAPVSSTTPTISGTTDQPNGSSVTVRNTANDVLCTATVSAGAWSCPASGAHPLAEGPNAITATTTDAAGNSATDAHIVTVDTTDPAVDVTGPTVPTSDTTPEISGTTDQPNGSSVIVTDADDNELCTAVVSGGTWACSPSSPLAEGDNEITVTTTDEAGNSGTDTHTVTVDTTDPAVDITGPAAPTNDTTPEISGTTDQPNGSSVIVTDADDNELCTAVVSGGTWACSPASPLAEGPNTVTATTTDEAGNSSSDTATVTVDTTDPTVDITGPGSLVSTATPRISGTTDQPDGSSVTVRDADDNLLCTAVVAGNTWGCDVSGSHPLGEGANTVTATTSDEAGNSATDSHVVTVDTTDPAVEVTAPAAPTNDTTPEISGTTDQPDGATVIVTDADDNELCSAVVSGGTWSCSPSSPLAEGDNEITVTTTDEAGNSGTDTHTVTVDTTDPAVDVTGPTVPTSDTTPEISGTTDQPNGSTVVVTDADDNELCSAVVSGGTWSCSPGSPLAEGDNEVTVTTTDEAGNSGTDTHTVTVDTTDPAVDITGPTVPTSDTTPEISGTTDQPDGSSVVVTDADDNELCTAVVSGGTWSCSPGSPLAEGDNEVTVTTTDEAGNSGTDTHTVTVDTTDPAVDITGPAAPTNDTTPEISGTTDQPDGATVVVTDADDNELCSAVVSGGAWSCSPSSPLSEGPNTVAATTTDEAGNSATDAHIVTVDTTDPAVDVTGPTVPTSDTTPEISGTTDQPNGSTVVVTDADDNELCSAVVSGGTWSCSPGSPLSEGPNTVTATTTDAAGNSATDAHIVTVDTTDPAVDVTGPTAPTSDTTPEISGTTDQPDGSSVVVTDADDNELCTAVVSGGAWACSPASPLAEGDNEVTVTTTDEAGNSGTDTQTVTVDTTDPAVDITGPTVPTSDTTPEISGTTDQPDGSAVVVTDADNNELCTAVVSGGAWACSPGSPLSEGANTVTATTTDEAGNSSSDTATVTVDTTDPTVDITGPAVPTNDTTPEISGTTDQPDGSSVVVTDADDNELCTAVVSGGAWSCSPGSPLAEGANTVTATTTDEAGNSNSDTASVTVDTTDPAVDITGPTGLINDTTPEITGSTDQPDGASVIVRNADNDVLCTANVAGGAWSCVVSDDHPLVEGANNLTATTTDEAGNSTSDVHTVTVDSTLPLIDFTGPDTPTNDNTPEITGTTDQPDGASVVVTDAGDNELCTAVASGGLWSCTSVALPEGASTITASTTDAAGNTATALLTVTVDTTDPAVDITGPNTPTNDNTPTIRGTTDQPDGASVTVLDENDDVLCTAVVASGEWSCNVGTTLPDGDSEIRVVTTDDVGNEGEDSITITIDTTPPALSVTGPVTPVTQPTPLITGTTDQPDGAVVAVKKGSEVICTAVVDGGEWSCSPARTDMLVEGPNHLTAETTDLAGNTTTEGHTLVLHLPAPPAYDIAITGPRGTIATNRPLITGTSTAPAGSPVVVTIDQGGTTAICSPNPVVQADGTWSCTSSVALPMGSVVITATIGAGGVSARAATTTAVVNAAGSDPTQCLKTGITIIDLSPKGKRATMRGFARTTYVGQTVSVRGKLEGRKKVLGRAKVKADGSFTVKFKAPKKKYWNTNKALYSATVGKESTKMTKLMRRVRSAQASYKNGKLTVKGDLVKPLMPKAKAKIQARTGCSGKLKQVGTTKIKKNGSFRVSLKYQASGVIWVRVATEVSKGGKKPRPLRTYSYLIPVIITD